MKRWKGYIKGLVSALLFIKSNVPSVIEEVASLIPPTADKTAQFATMLEKDGSCTKLKLCNLNIKKNAENGEEWFCINLLFTALPAWPN